MIDELLQFLRLVAGTVIHRPYVYAFFVCYLAFAWRHLRGRDVMLYTLLSYGIAFAAEYSSTRNGFPFGKYVYVEDTRVDELWVSNVPFWDSLSFVFLSYFSWIVAASVVDPRSPSSALLKPVTAIMGGVLMMLLDVVIDPLTLLGDRWFLGRIYYYPQGGPYFGVTLSNFAGWFFVGTMTIFAFQRLCSARGESWTELSTERSRMALGVYAGVLIFNLAITAWIGEWLLFAASTGLASMALAACVKRVFGRPGAAEVAR